MSNNRTVTTTRTRKPRTKKQGMSDASISRLVEKDFQSQLRTLTPRNRGDQDSYSPEGLSLMDDQFVHDLTSDDEFVGDQDGGTETRSPWLTWFTAAEPVLDPDEEPESDDIVDYSSEYGGMFQAVGIRVDMDHFLPPYVGPRIQRFTFVNGRPERIPDPIPTAAAAAPSADERAGLVGPPDSDVVKAAQRAAYANNEATTKVA